MLAKLQAAKRDAEGALEAEDTDRARAAADRTASGPRSRSYGPLAKPQTHPCGGTTCSSTPSAGGTW